MQRSKERALFEVPPAVRRHRPNFLVEVDFGPPHSQNFAGARSGQNAKFLRQRRRGFPRPQLGNEDATSSDGIAA
jgi:hypothetical protein